MFECLILGGARWDMGCICRLTKRRLVFWRSKGLLRLRCSQIGSPAKTLSPASDMVHSKKKSRRITHHDVPTLIRGMVVNAEVWLRDVHHALIYLSANFADNCLASKI